VALRCDAAAEMGVGHVMRCLALAEGLADAGFRPYLVGDLGGLDLVERRVTEAGLAVHAAPPGPEALLAAVRSEGAAAAVLDGYHLAPETAAVLMDGGVPTAALCDFPEGIPPAPLVVNQNFGAEDVMPDLPGQRVLAGVRYSLLSNRVRRRRPDAPTAAAGPARNVLVVLGGTDAAGAGPLATDLLLRTGRPLHVTTIAPRPASAAALRALVPGDGQELTVLGAVDDLPALVTAADLVVSAAGTSVWELCCVGAPAALICVADNQLPAYRKLVARGVNAGLGTLDELRRDPGSAIAELTRLIDDPAARNALARTGHALVDGNGRARVAAALAELLGD
jgi:spore coat polysaccharide biosynthesis predicted glycosyltransferase SpsG